MAQSRPFRREILFRGGGQVGVSGGRWASRTRRTSGVGESTYKEHDWRCQEIISYSGKYFSAPGPAPPESSEAGEGPGRRRGECPGRVFAAQALFHGRNPHFMPLRDIRI